MVCSISWVIIYTIVDVDSSPWPKTYLWCCNSCLFFQRTLMFQISSQFCIFRYHLKDVIVGKIYFILVRIKIKHMEIQIIKRETTGTGPNTYNENETIAKYEIMDGAPVRGEWLVPVLISCYRLCPFHLLAFVVYKGALYVARPPVLIWCFWATSACKVPTIIEWNKYWWIIFQAKASPSDYSWVGMNLALLWER